MMKKLIAAAGLVLLAQAGCGGGNDLSKADSQKAMVTVMNTMSTGMTEVSTAEQPTDTNQASLQVTSDCLGGGNMALDGSMTFDQQSFAFDLQITLDQCRTGNIVADGALTFAGSSSESGFSISMTGSFTFSGEISGSCDIDISMDVDPNNMSAAVATGSFCGYDAADFDMSAQGTL